ncbi:PRC-barrel domain-containing protein [Aeromicrobium terrae]|uniref:PRC-barrel domain-containing protein n=1 Tax=Aeromicrobium terrae TaxID=2498846 RepID=A0A5C8NFV5_9ACTN|nr:PRC-barrel domain-containing protein [Aeromicrobium terrae]TXL57490.1 hypothetical protein FHP06_14040 [Aeromicrobium terrae]
MTAHLELSRVLGCPVVTADGVRAGVVADLTARLPGGAPRVERLAVGTRRRAEYLVPWSSVQTVDAGMVRLSSPAQALDRDHRIGGGGLTDRALSEEEILLGRDVMDSQVVDLAGLRLSRVSDVLLETAEDGVWVAAVDLGIGAVLARLGLRRLGERLPPVVVAWEDLHLASPRGHSVQLATAAEQLRRLDAATLSAVVTRMPTEPATDVLRAIGPEHADRVLRASHAVHRRRLRDELVGEPSPRLRRSRRTAGWRVHRSPHGTGEES